MKRMSAVEAYLYHYSIYCSYMWMSDDVCL